MESKKYAVAVFLVLLGFTAFAQARDTALLDKAFADSTKERAGVEREYLKNDVSTRKSKKSVGNQSISLELGDELGPEGGGSRDQLKFHDRNRVFHEKAVSSKLDREWKDVNRSMKEASAHKAR